MLVSILILIYKTHSVFFFNSYINFVYSLLNVNSWIRRFKFCVAKCGNMDNKRFHGRPTCYCERSCNNMGSSSRGIFIRKIWNVFLIVSLFYLWSIFYLWCIFLQCSTIIIFSTASLKLGKIIALMSSEETLSNLQFFGFSSFYGCG